MSFKKDLQVIPQNILFNHCCGDLDSLNSAQNFLSQLFNDLFKNNANRSEMAEKRHNQNYFMEMITVEGVYDYLMYVGKFSPPTSRDRCFRTIRHLCSCTDGESFFFPLSLLRPAFNFSFLLRSSRLPHPRLAAPPVNDRQDPVQEHAGSLHWLLPSVQTEPGGPGAPAGVTHHPAQRCPAEMFRNKDSVVSRKKKEKICPSKNVHHLSPPPPDAVFCESSPSRSSHDRQRRAKKTFEEMMSYIPGIPLTFFSSVMSFVRHRPRC